MLEYSFNGTKVGPRYVHPPVQTLLKICSPMFKMRLSAEIAAKRPTSAGKFASKAVISGQFNYLCAASAKD